MPTFVISARQIKADLIDIKSADRIYIENKGHAISEFQPSQRVFFEVKLTKTPGFFKKAFIPINGYYIANELTAKGDGLLATIGNYHNNLKASDIENKFQKYCSGKGEICSIEIFRYVRIYYRDALGQQHVEYFNVPLIFGAYKMTPEDGETIFRDYEQKWENYGFPDFEKITVEQLYNLTMKS